MAKTDKRKRSIYIPADMLRELLYESARLDRTVSWIVQQCVKRALPEIKKMPSVNEVPDDFQVRIDTASGVSSPAHGREEDHEPR